MLDETCRRTTMVDVGSRKALRQTPGDQMARPLAHGEPTVQVAFRLPESLVERLDTFVERQREALPGLNFTRADAARILLMRGLDAAEARPPARTRR